MTIPKLKSVVSESRVNVIHFPKRLQKLLYLLLSLIAIVFVSCLMIVMFLVSSSSSIQGGLG